MFHYFAGAERDAMARALFAALEQGVITAERPHEYAFVDAALAHHDLEQRMTAGAVVLAV